MSESHCFTQHILFRFSYLNSELLNFTQCWSAVLNAFQCSSALLRFRIVQLFRDGIAHHLSALLSMSENSKLFTSLLSNQALLSMPIISSIIELSYTLFFSILSFVEGSAFAGSVIVNSMFSIVYHLCPFSKINPKSHW